MQWLLSEAQGGPVNDAPRVHQTDGRRAGISGSQSRRHMMMTIGTAVLFPSLALSTHRVVPTGSRSSVASFSMLLERETLDNAMKKRYSWQRGSSTDIDWIRSPSGFLYIEDCIGDGPSPARGDVVQLHYTVSLLSSGTTLGTTHRGPDQLLGGKDQPLTMAVGKHAVPIWDEALRGMRVGGKRRMVVPPDALPDFQSDKVPGEKRELRLDFEVLSIIHKASPLAMLASLVPPHKRPRVLAQATARQTYLWLYLLSFVPYFMPYDQQPTWYHDGKPIEQIRAEREQRATTFANERFLGGDIDTLNSLFP